METTFHKSDNNDFLQILAQVLGEVCNDLFFLFDASKKIIFTNSDLNIVDLYQLHGKIKLNNPNNEKQLLEFLNESNNNSYEYFDYIEINNTSRFAKIILNSIIFNEILYYSVFIRMMSEDLCAECESKFISLFLKAPVGIVSVEADTGKILEVNPEFCSMLGYTKEELLTKFVSDITLVEDYTNEKSLTYNLLNSNVNKLEFTKRYLKKDNSILYASLTSTYIKSSERKPVIMGIILDITNKIKLLQSEKEKKSLIEKISRTTPDTILIFNIKSQIFTFTNHSLMNKSIDGKQEELTFIKFMSLIHPDDLKRFLEESNLLIASNDENIHECSFRLLLKDNQIRWLLCRGIVFTKDEKDYPEEILLQMTDITSQKELEESLRQSYRQINEKNKILEIQKHELLQAKYELEKSEQQLIEANLNKDKFFSIIAHDLKNPFNSLFGSASFLAQNFEICDKKDIKTLTDNIYNSAKVIYGLLENLLSWARLQTNRLVLNIERLDIFEVIKNILPLYKDVLIVKNIKIEINGDPDQYCLADKYSIETVMRNLISNAIKFSFIDGKIIIGIKNQNNELVLSVQDFGIGMTSEKLSKIFTLSNDKTTPGTLHESGTGLGLLICKEFVEKNDGKIWVESTINKGTTFFISLHTANF